VRRLTLAGHILQLSPDTPASMAMKQLPDRSNRRCPSTRPGDRHSRKIYRSQQSAGMVFAEWLVIGIGEKASLPNTPAGVGVAESRLA